MESLLMANGALSGIWPLVVLIMLWVVLMCLKTIGHGCDRAVSLHNLKVQAHQLRLRQQQELKSIRRRSTLCKQDRPVDPVDADEAIEVGELVPEAEITEPEAADAEPALAA